MAFQILEERDVERLSRLLTDYEEGRLTQRQYGVEEIRRAPIETYVGLADELIPASTGEPSAGSVTVYGTGNDLLLDDEGQYQLQALSLWNVDIQECQWVHLNRDAYSGNYYVVSIPGTYGCSTSGSGSGCPCTLPDKICVHVGWTPNCTLDNSSGVDVVMEWQPYGIPQGQGLLGEFSQGCILGGWSISIGCANNGRFYFIAYDLDLGGAVYTEDVTDKLHCGTFGFDPITFTVPGGLYQMTVTYSNEGDCDTSTQWYCLTQGGIGGDCPYCTGTPADEICVCFSPMADNLCHDCSNFAGIFTLTRGSCNAQECASPECSWDSGLIFPNSCSPYFIINWCITLNYIGHLGTMPGTPFTITQEGWYIQVCTVGGIPFCEALYGPVLDWNCHSNQTFDRFGSAGGAQNLCNWPDTVTTGCLSCS